MLRHQRAPGASLGGVPEIVSFPTSEHTTPEVVDWREPRSPHIQSPLGPRRTGRVFSGEQMNKPAQIEIVRRAYQLWQEAGQPEGKDQEFYYLAEQELRNADKSSPMRTPDNL